MAKSSIPHIRIVLAVTAFALMGFGAVSIYVLGWGADEVTQGSIIGVWIGAANGALGFWLGSSSGGKARTDEPEPVVPPVEEPLA